MKFTVEIECDNAAFEDDSGAEVARILRNLAAELENNPGVLGRFPLRDTNGNRVGEAVLRE